MASPANPQNAPSGLPELVLRAARDVGQVETAFDAELLLSTVIGGVYAGLGPDRAQGLDAFLGLLREHLAVAEDPVAPVVAAVLDAGSGVDGPAWLPAVGRVRPTGGYAYGDRYGDQTSYLATYEYEDAELGGPDHVVVVLADHNLGTAQDLLIVAPAGSVLAQLRESVATDADAMTWLAEVPLGTVRKAATAYLRATDLAELAPADSLTANRWLAVSRLSALPDEVPVEPAPSTPVPVPVPVNGTEPTDAKATLINQFLDGPEAQLSGLASAAGARRESVSYCLGLVVDFAVSRGGDPLRWSPKAVETFLTEWVHQHAILDKDDRKVLPDALATWVTWSGRRVGLPDAAVRNTFAQVATDRPEFVRLCETGERQSPAVRAMAQLVAEGVDLADEAAVDAWLRTYNADHG